jgi:hypothetical protein
MRKPPSMAKLCNPRGETRGYRIQPPWTPDLARSAANAGNRSFSIFDRQVLALGTAGFAQALEHKVRGQVRRFAAATAADSLAV